MRLAFSITIPSLIVCTTPVVRNIFPSVVAQM